MPKIYLVVGVDQEGDACWNIVPTIGKALVSADEMDETAFAPMTIHEVDTSTLASAVVPRSSEPEISLAG